MPRPCKKPCCKNLYSPYQRPTRNLFKCKFPNCGQSFKYKSVLTLHEFKEHTQEKSKPVAYVKPFTQLAVVPLVETEKHNTDIDLSKEIKNIPQKVTEAYTKVDLLKNDKTPKLVLNDILAPQHYIVKSTDTFTCPICKYQGVPGAMYNHMKTKHKSVFKLVKLRVQCSECGLLHHPNSIKNHKRSCKSKRKETLLSICY